jgi:hypothetical protein
MVETKKWTDANGEYHTDSPEDRNVFHNWVKCPRGTSIEKEHRFPGRNGRTFLCKDCYAHWSSQ